MSQKIETVLHGFGIRRDLSAKLRVISICKSKNAKHNVPMAEIVNDALEEYFINHKEEIKKDLSEYHANGGFLTINEKEFCE